MEGSQGRHSCAADRKWAANDERVMSPGGLTVGDGGADYVSAGTLSPDGRAVILITL